MLGNKPNLQPDPKVRSHTSPYIRHDGDHNSNRPHVGPEIVINGPDWK